MADSFAIASRSELLSIMSGRAIMGECSALMITVTTRPLFTFSPGAGVCSRMQSGDNVFT